MEPIIGIGSVLVIAGLVAFAVNVIRNARASDVAERVHPPLAA